MEGRMNSSVAMGAFSDPAGHSLNRGSGLGTRNGRGGLFGQSRSRTNGTDQVGSNRNRGAEAAAAILAKIDQEVDLSVSPGSAIAITPQRSAASFDEGGAREGSQSGDCNRMTNSLDSDDNVTSRKSASDGNLDNTDVTNLQTSKCPTNLSSVQSATRTSQGQDGFKAPASAAEEVSILIDKMLECYDDDELQLRAMRSLRRLSTTHDGRTLIGNSGGIQLVADCMRRFSSNNQLSSTCCMVIANVCYGSDENKEKARKSRCIDMIISCLGSINLSGSEMAYVCLAARNVTNNCRPNQLYISTNGGVEALCKAISRYEDDVDVQVQALAAVGNTAHLNKTSQMKLRESGALGLIVETMQRHNTVAILQENCLAAIGHLCADNERNQRELGSLGGVERTVGAMKLHRTDVGVQIRACVALRHLAFEERNRERIGESEGIRCILEALGLVRSEGKDSDLPDVLKALSNATFDQTENKLAVIRSGGLFTVAGLVVPESPPELLESAVRVLRNMADCSEEVRQNIRETNVIYTILDCMRDRMNEEGVAEHALALFLNLVADGLDIEGVVEDLDPDEVIPLIQTWMEMFPQVNNIQRHGESLIRQFEIGVEKRNVHSGSIWRRGKRKASLGSKLGKHLHFGRMGSNASASKTRSYELDEIGETE